jgi:Putative Ig domain
MRGMSSSKWAALCVLCAGCVLSGCFATPAPRAASRPGYYNRTSLSRTEGARNRHFSTRIQYSSNFIRNPQYTIWSTTPLPPGLTLNKTSGIISGTPSQSGIWHVKVGVRDRDKGTPDQPPGKTRWYVKTFEIRIYDKYTQPR